MKYELTLNGHTYLVEVAVAEPMLLPEFEAYSPAAPATPVLQATPAVPAAPTALIATGEADCVSAPMPGNILKVNVVAGQAVKEGDVLVVLEAMKMENEIMAPKSGTVTQVAVTKGATVETGVPLVFIG